MAVNIDPIFSKAADIQSGGAVLGPNANTSLDGSGGSNIYSVFQADATNGGFIQKIRFKACAAAGTTIAATVSRAFICNVTGAFTPGSSNTVSTAWLWDEINLPSIVISSTGASSACDIPMNIALPAGYRILITFGTSTGSAGTGWIVTVVGGKY